MLWRKWIAFVLCCAFMPLIAQPISAVDDGSASCITKVTVHIFVAIEGKTNLLWFLLRPQVHKQYEQQLSRRLFPKLALSESNRQSHTRKLRRRSPKMLLCTMVRDESNTIVEWIAFHLQQGFNKVNIANNKFVLSIVVQIYLQPIDSFIQTF